MSKKNPVVTIGLPVFNGAKYLRFALDSILAQTFQDFELIISDNASTDDTRAICQEYALKDDRIKYSRNKRNVGLAANHNIVLRLCEGKYFKWAAYDDVLKPTFLEECVKVLENDPSVVICHTQTGQIDETGKITGLLKFGVHFNSSNVSRFTDIISMRNYAWLLLLGVIRASELNKTCGLGSYISADRVLLGELSLYGDIGVVPNILFYRRQHTQSYTNKNHKSVRAKQGCWEGRDVPKLVFPYWRVLIEYVKIVKRSPQNWFVRQRCNYQIFKWVIKEGWVLMAMDIGSNILCSHPFVLRVFAPLSRNLFSKAGIQ